MKRANIPIQKFKDAPIQIIDGDRGINYPKDSEWLENGHCLFLNTGNVTENGFNFNNCQFISFDKDQILGKGKLKRNDLVMTTRGTVGNVGYYNNKVPFGNIRINSGMVIFRVDQAEIMPSFLYQYLRSAHFYKQVNALRTGAAQPQLPIRDIKCIKIQIPQIAEQDKIAGILSDYDDFIDTNRRRIQLLEETARLLFREWFVYFRFPGHKKIKIADGVPEGWRRKKVKDLGVIVTGKTPSTKNASNFNGAVPFIKTPDMHQSSIIINTEELLSETGASSQNNKFLPSWSIMVSCIGTVGIVAMNLFKAQTNQQINSVIPRKEIYRYYSFFCLSRLKPLLEAIGGGSTMANVNKNKFENLNVLIPPEDILKEFHETVDPLFKQIAIVLQQNQKLAQARDLLLPKLMKGEIRV